MVVGTAGGAAPALLAVASVVNGCAATATTVTTTTMVAAGVAVGGSVALGYSTLDALETSKTPQEFADQGESALVNTLIGGFWGGVQGYLLSRSSQARSTSEESEKNKANQNKQSPKKGIKTKPYSKHRPSYGKGQVEAVYNNAKNEEGKVIDPSGAEIPWDKTKPRNGQ